MLCLILSFKTKKEIAVLLEVSTNRFYEVIDITAPFSEILADQPVKIKTAIFIINGKIVCDGLIVGGRILIGPEMTKEFPYDYKKAEKTLKLLFY